MSETSYRILEATVEGTVPSPVPICVSEPITVPNVTLTVSQGWPWLLLEQITYWRDGFVLYARGEEERTRWFIVGALLFASALCIIVIKRTTAYLFDKLTQTIHRVCEFLGWWEYI